MFVVNTSSMLVFALVVCTIYIGVTGCKTPPKKNERSNLYFDINNFTDRETERLEKLNVKVRKKAIINGKSEEKLFEEVDWQKELEVFKEGDINKPAWQGLYQVDSTNIQGRVAGLTFTCIRPEMRVRIVDVRFDVAREEVEQVQIVLKTDNSLYHSERIMTYKPAKGYTIEGGQDILFFDEDFFSVEAVFIY